MNYRKNLVSLHQGRPLFDAIRVFQTTVDHYCRALRSIEQSGRSLSSEVISTVGALPPTVRARVLLYPSVRKAIEEVVWEVCCGPESTPTGSSMESLTVRLRYALDSYQDGMGFPMENALVISPLNSTFLWGAHEDDNKQESESELVSKLFDRLIANDAGAESCIIRDSDRELYKFFDTAIKYLDEISSVVTLEIGLSARCLAFIDYARWNDMEQDEYREIGQSISSHAVPGVCFFSYHSMSSVERLAEAIYHECLHKKLSNLLSAERLLKNDYDPDDLGKFDSYWNRDTEWNSRYWGFDRALYAFHVYVHLVVFYGSLLERGRASPWALQQFELAQEKVTALYRWILERSAEALSRDGLSTLSELWRATNLERRV